MSPEISESGADYLTFVYVPIAFVIAGFIMVLEVLLFNLFASVNEVATGVMVDFLDSALAAAKKLAGYLFLDYFMGTRWAAYFLRMLGGRVGRDVYLECYPIVDIGLLTLEDRVTVDTGVSILPYVMRDMKLVFMETTVREDVTLGPRSNVSSGSIIEPYSALGPLSMASDGETLDGGSYAEGTPLVHVGHWYDPHSSPPGPDPEMVKVFEEMRQ